MDIVILDYSFLFDTGDMFSHLYEFEGELAKFFAERGIEAKKVNSSPDRQVLYLKRIDPMIINQATPPVKPEEQKSLKQIVSQMSKKTWQNGKYRKDNPTIREK